MRPVQTFVVAPAVFSVLCSLTTGCGGNNPSKPTVTVVIAPQTVPSLLVGATQPFEAEAKGADNKGVTWSVEESEAEAWLSLRGPATASFTPLAPGTFHVVATSVALSSAYAKATVTVLALPPAPPTAAIALPPGAVVLLPDPAPTSAVWSILEPDGGSVDQDGRYTAPHREGVYHAVTTDLADPCGASVIEVTVRTDYSNSPLHTTIAQDIP